MEKIKDYISGIEINATPEELESVQVFSRQLVEDYGYPKEYIQTQPQHRVKVRPSDKKKEYPIDIAIFKNSLKRDEDLYIVVECKNSNRKDGRDQLENYLTLSSAYLGVWFNGNERLFIRKYNTDKGEVLFKDIPNIPKFEQRVEDIGLFNRQDLRQTHNLKSIFKSIRNYLRANTVGVTRDEIFAQQLINIIFCKIYDEKYTIPTEPVRFRVGINEDPVIVQNRILSIFRDVKQRFPDVIENTDDITLDTNSILFIVGELQNYALMECERDVIADAFEVFIDNALKGGLGQFFTPRNVVRMIVEILKPNENQKIIDPACGSGGFLIESLKYVWKEIENKYQNWPIEEISRQKIDVATRNFRGIDKDYFLSKVAKAYMNLVGDGTSGIYCEDSLDNPDSWKFETQTKVKFGDFDLILTNPPFGDKIKVQGYNKLSQYELAHSWKYLKKTGIFEKKELKDKISPQILFIERCLHLLKTNGILAMVLPEGIFGNPSDRYIWNHILQNAQIMAIISMPSETFQPHTHFKTSVLILKKCTPKSDYPIFMSIPKSCGHNKNGKEIYLRDTNGKYILDDNNQKIIDDEISLVSSYYQNFKNNHSNITKIDNSHLGFSINYSQIVDSIFIPDYYDPELKSEIATLKKSDEYYVKSIKDLINDELISTNSGVEVGSEYYGMGDIPFIRTSDIVNWELKIDPIKCIPESVYKQFKHKQDIRENDILFVKDGTFLIGNSAIVTNNTEIVIQSHILKIRVNNPDMEYINPFYLLYLLNTPIVKKQISRFTFIQGTISTVGERFYDIILPIHSDKQIIRKISNKVRTIINAKNSIRESINSVINM